MCIAPSSNPVRKVLLSPIAKFRKWHKEISQGSKLIQQFMEGHGFSPTCIQSWAPSGRGDTFSAFIPRHMINHFWFHCLLSSNSSWYVTHFTLEWEKRDGILKPNWTPLSIMPKKKKISFFPQFRTHILLFKSGIFCWTRILIIFSLLHVKNYSKYFIFIYFFSFFSHNTMR